MFLLFFIDLDLLEDLVGGMGFVGSTDEAAHGVLGILREDIVGIFIVLELKMEVFDDFIGRFHLLLIALDLDV